MEYLALIIMPVALISIWFTLSKLVSTACTFPQGLRICLLIAHADDEAMFFAPSVVKLADPALQNRFEIICLSKGKDSTLRVTRSRELLLSAANLGLRSPEDVSIIDDEERFPDSMSVFWSAEDVAKVLRTKYQQNYPGNIPDLDILITFDDCGISSHANHISLLHGARYWLRNMSQDSCDNVCLYSLTSTNIFRKYVSIFDMPLTVMMHFWRVMKNHEANDDHPESLLFFSWISDYRRAQRSMTNCHKSQMLWFRFGWIMLSRYISINDLYRQRI